MKQELLFGLKPYTKPKVEMLTLSDRVHFLQQGFSARFLNENDPLEPEEWEGGDFESDIF